MTVTIPHPAKYTDALFPAMADMLMGRCRILDPFGGTGKVFELSAWLPAAQIEAVEIEPEWAACHRRTYRHMLGRALHPDNSGALQWGDAYRTFHVAAWTEARRVLSVGGAFVLNIKDHIRAGVVQPVTEWHVKTLCGLGFVEGEHERINTPSMRYGRNADKRVEYESVILFELEAKE